MKAKCSMVSTSASLTSRCPLGYRMAFANPWKRNRRPSCSFRSSDVVQGVNFNLGSFEAKTFPNRASPSSSWIPDRSCTSAPTRLQKP
jgi:hypothetical protein